MITLDLRPLSLGELLDRTFFLYRRNFLLFLGIAAMPYVVIFAVTLIVSIPVFILVRGKPPSNFPAPTIIGAGIVTLVAIVVLIMVVSLYSAGASVFAVSEIYAGRRATIRQSFRMVRGKIGTIFVIGIFSIVIVTLGLIALIIPGIYVMFRLPVATAAALIEDIGPWAAIRRSFALTQGFAGRAVMISLLAVALASGVGFLLKLPFFVLLVVSGTQSHYALLWNVLAQVGGVFGNIFVAPVTAIGFALFYYDLRVRKEAFDLQMMMQAIGGAPAPPPITGGVPSMFGRDAF